MSRRTTRLSVLDLIRTHLPGLVNETTEQTIKSGVGAIQIIGGVRKPTGKPPGKPKPR
jgi:hypothetical protein